MRVGLLRVDVPGLEDGAFKHLFEMLNVVQVALEPGKRILEHVPRAHSVG
jgi:hypothetical protein